MRVLRDLFFFGMRRFLCDGRSDYFCRGVSSVGRYFRFEAAQACPQFFEFATNRGDTAGWVGGDALHIRKQSAQSLTELIIEHQSLPSGP
jgi:hypothetical protein